MFPCSFFFRAYFNPLPPHGGRPADRPKRSAVKVFQSTPSAWRETGTVPAVPMQRVHFNPLPPHGGRHHDLFATHSAIAFQSTPSAWRETQAGRAAAAREGFQSTPSAWRETWNHYKAQTGDNNFNPLPPHGGRPVTVSSPSAQNPFQSTPSAWRETASQLVPTRVSRFQSTPSAWRETRQTDRNGPP